LRQTRLAIAIAGTVNLTFTNSGHNVMLYLPQLVADEIIAVVQQVRG
jgi:hypothetical protein